MLGRRAVPELVAAGHEVVAVSRRQESFAPTYRDHGSGWIAEDHPLDPVDQTCTVPAAEASAELVRAEGLTDVVLRFGLFYGAGSADSRNWLTTAAKGRLVLPGPGDRYTSMVSVDDAAAAVMAVLQVPAGCYNVVEDEPMTGDEHAQVLRMRPRNWSAHHAPRESPW